MTTEEAKWDQCLERQEFFFECVMYAADEEGRQYAISKLREWSERWEAMTAQGQDTSGS
jgi:hypothetical protein